MFVLQSIGDLCKDFPSSNNRSHGLPGGEISPTVLKKQKEVRAYSDLQTLFVRAVTHYWTLGLAGETFSGRMRT